MKVLRKSMLRIGLLVGLLVLAAAVGLACAQPTQVRVNNGVIETSEDGDAWTPDPGGDIGGGAGGGLSQEQVDARISLQVDALAPVFQAAIDGLAEQIADLGGGASPASVQVFDPGRSNLAGIVERVNFSNGGITYITVLASGFTPGETVSFRIGDTLVGTTTASSTGTALFEDVELSTNFSAGSEGEQVSYTVSAVGSSSNITAIGGLIVEDKAPN